MLGLVHTLKAPEVKETVSSPSKFLLITYTCLQETTWTLINRKEKERLQLCRSFSLYIVDGQIRGDSLGRFTYGSTAL